MTILRFNGRAWRDRVVVVTGGTSGIGREFAVRLEAEGAKVIACARHEGALRELQHGTDRLRQSAATSPSLSMYWRLRPPFRTATAGSMS